MSWARWLIAIILWLCLTVVVGAQDAGQPTPPRGWSADLPAVSDGRHLWLGVADTQPTSVGQPLWPLSAGERPPVPMTALYHADLRAQTPAAPVWEAVTRLQGTLAEGGLIAAEGQLTLIFRDGQIRRLTLRPAPLPGDWYFSETSLHRLPADTTLRAAVADGPRLWALVRVDSGVTLERLDRTQAFDLSSADDTGGAGESADEARQRQRRRSLVLGLPIPPPADRKNDPGDGDGAAGEDGSTDENQRHDEAGSATGEAADAASEDSALADASAWPAERLLVLDSGGWRVVPLPGDWPSQMPVSLVRPRTSGERPVLVVRRPAHATPNEAGSDAEPSRHLDLYEPLDEHPPSDPSAASRDRHPYPAGWTKLTLPLEGQRQAVVLRVGRQLVVASVEEIEAQLTAQLSVIRGQRLIDLGQLSLDGTQRGTDRGRWAAVPAGGAGARSADGGGGAHADAVAWLVGRHDLGRRLLELTQDPSLDLEPGPVLTQMDLRGGVDRPAMTMEFEPRDLWAEVADTVILLGVVLISTVLLVTFWRRDPRANVLVLPRGTVLADPLRRGLAGLIDLAPAVLWVLQAYELNLQQLYDRWPGRGLGTSLEAMVPGLVIIGLVILHTTLLEALTGRSLGKWVTRLRIAGLDGQRPRLWQVLVRGGLRVFDLLAYPLLILVVISPYRQRLGDMVGRTVVVRADAGAEAEGENGGGSTADHGNAVKRPDGADAVEQATGKERSDGE